MTRGFAAIAIPSTAHKDRLERGVERARSLGLTPSVVADGLVVLTSGDIKVNALGASGGALIGDAFRRLTPTQTCDSQHTASEAARIVGDGRASMDMWGDYVAIYFGGDGDLRFLHSPCGSLNLYYMPWDECLLMASDAALLLGIAGSHRSLNWDMIAHAILWDDVSCGKTCIDGIGEIRSGECGRWPPGAVSVEAIWDPWRFTEADVSIWESREAIELVRQEIHRCVAARKTPGTHYAIDLSGGLDSSIVAAACGAAGMKATGINLFDSGTEGDERHFARGVADHLGLALKEGMPKAGDIDLDRCARGHLPRPYARAFVQALDHSAYKIASDIGATTFLNGGGGDSVFCHLQSSAPVVDALRSRGRAPGAARMAFEVARSAQCNVWDVISKSGKKLWRGSPADRMTANREFVSDALEVKQGASPLPPPRLRPLPGKVEQVHGIYRSLSSINGFARSDRMKGIFPLLSQPLVEACLRIPSWLWLGGGRNRLIARLAMEGELPTMAIWRISKGGLGQLQRDIMCKKRGHIRAKLLDGQLARQGFIDADAIGRELENDGSYRIESLYRLMRLHDIETWCNA
ncbi:asparagine synthase-related protein [Sphingopyxis macrogoltabida]|uniref:asparagine synthase (glutamine-hydrolyzing) n=1 Tax=Sphingopyxis macrogoltabida TaxID=33050 RepID=A0AAC9AZV2_SPHMC|nr:asparagine synthase C-terminal domain-containing protein [Sphingopyxis macrogoltabida]ALJ16609.1 hypothetical protein LH19_27800 [Sphingopyxis macrogoltabida]AMU92837.1 hypothetical protein ATM17_31775 [Sphingopyxis macrogoltabida]